MLVACALAAGCAVLIPRSRDYMFGVTVLVLDEDGGPVNEAMVSLVTGQTIFEAVAPVTTVERSTDARGGCVFMYIAHQPSVTYRVKVRKKGFLAQELAGVAAPYAHLKVELKRAAEAGSGESGALQNNEMRLTRSTMARTRGPRSWSPGWMCCATLESHTIRAVGVVLRWRRTIGVAADGRRS